MKMFDLTKDNIDKLLLSFSIPCIISLLINFIYNIIDQIFLGQGLGLLESNATNIIFPLVIVISALANLIGNGTSNELSLKLKMGRNEEVKKVVGSSISITFLFSIILSFIAYIILPQLVYYFGSSTNGYSYALDYGRLIILGIPFMMISTVLFSIIRTDGSFKHSMFILFSGVIINIVLNVIFIFCWNMGVKGCALATLVGQLVSFLLSLLYLSKIKNVKLKYKDFKPNFTFLRVLSLDLSSFICQMIMVMIFIFMNYLLIKYGNLFKYKTDITLAVYSTISKINCLFIFLILGIVKGSQPIIGYNYGAGKYNRVRLVLNKVFKINFIVGMIFNLLLIIFPDMILGLFIKKTDPNYYLFMEFAILMCRISLMLCSLKFMEVTASVVLQSFRKSIKVIIMNFIRPFTLLFIMVFILLFSKSLYGVLYAFLITDIICFFICCFLFSLEYKDIINTKENMKINVHDNTNNILYGGRHFVVTISREYGSGGHYVGKLLANKLGVKFYDKQLISMASKVSGLSEWYIEETEQRLSTGKFIDNNDDRLFVAESKVIKELANRESCVIVGRCADYILKDDPNAIKLFLYSDQESKINRVILYYNINSENAKKTIYRENYERAKHYKYYTSQDWSDTNNYDLMINVDQLGVEATVEQIISYINKKNKFSKKR